MHSNDVHTFKSFTFSTKIWYENTFSACIRKKFCKYVFCQELLSFLTLNIIQVILLTVMMISRRFDNYESSFLVPWYHKQVLWLWLPSIVNKNRLVSSGSTHSFSKRGFSDRKTVYLKYSLYFCYLIILKAHQIQRPIRYHHINLRSKLLAKMTKKQRYKRSQGCNSCIEWITFELWTGTCNKIVYRHALNPNSDSVFRPDGSYLSWQWGSEQLINYSRVFKKLSSVSSDMWKSRAYSKVRSSPDSDIFIESL